MLCEQFEVQATPIRPTAGSTHTWVVPAYEVEVIKKVWRQLCADGGVTVRATGLFAPYQLAEELRRMKRTWSTVPEGGTRSAFESAFPTDEAFQLAWEDAVRKGTALAEQVERDRAVQLAVAKDSESANESANAQEPAKPAAPAKAVRRHRATAAKLPAGLAREAAIDPATA